VSTCGAILFSCERHAVGADHQHVVAVGEIDVATGPRLTHVLHEAHVRARHIVLDLDGTTFIDAAGGRILLAAAAHARITTGTFRIVTPRAAVTRLLGLIGADLALEGALATRAGRRAGAGEWDLRDLRAPTASRAVSSGGPG
jgi:anti-anti-sigma factor